MKLLQFTNIHLTTPGDTIGGRDPNSNFERALDHALARHDDAEALIVTGDLSDWGERADYERLKARLERLPLPWRLCIGNHDDRETFLSVFPDHADEDGHVQTILPLSEGTAILLDTWGPETHAGHFCETRAAWVDRALASASGPVHLFLHHNPIPTHLPPMDSIMLLDHARLGDVVARWREKIAHIHFGHCHIPISGSLDGVPVSGIRGTNHAGFAAFGEAKLLSSSDLPESYAVIFGDGMTVTKHMVEYGYAGPIRVEASPDYATWSRDMVR